MNTVLCLLALLGLLSLFLSCQGSEGTAGWEEDGRPQSLIRRKLQSEGGEARSTGGVQESQGEVPSSDPVWPDEMLGADQWTDFVGRVKVLHEGVASCAGIRSPRGKKPTKVIARGHVGPSDIAALSRYQDGVDSPPPFRLMVWVAKNGLGNTIRGFLSTFFYAFLAGRQLVRSPEGSHGKVMRSLCRGFKCPYIDILNFKGRLPRHTANICHRHLQSTLGDPRPVMVGDCDVLLTFWAYNASLRQCVLDSFGCQDDWCAMSRAELLLLGSPSDDLGEVIDESMTLVPALGTETGPQAGQGQDVTGAGQGEPGTGQGARRRLLGEATSKSMTLVRALGMETGRRLPGEVTPKAMTLVRALGMETGRRLLGEVTSKSMTLVRALGMETGRRRLGDEIGWALKTGSEVKEGDLQAWRKLSSWTKGSSTMVTHRDAQGQREEQQQKQGQEQQQQQQQGQQVPPAVISAKAATSSEQMASSGSPEAVPRSLRLRFDLALHIRTLYRCVEKSASGPGCQAGDLNHAIAVADFSPELRKFVHTYDWECISQLLSFLHNLKFPSASTSDSQQGPHRLFGSPDDADKLQQFVHDSSGFQASRRIASRPWTIEKARQVAPQAGGGTGGGEELTGAGGSSPSARSRKLSIFLATDSEVLRPLFVEFLRPFGHVVFSKGRVVHLDRGTGEERLRLPTVAEFYLMSKASVLVSFTRRMSSFLQHAAMYGNGTLISRGGDRGCKYLLDHVAQRIRTT